MASSDSFACLARICFGYRRGRGGEVDVVQVVFGDSVAGDDEQVAGAKRNHLRRPDFRYPVADDASGQRALKNGS